MTPQARRAETVAVFSSCVSVLFVGLLWFLAYWTKAASGWVLIAPAGASLLVWLFVLIHLKMRRAAWDEEEDLRQLKERRKDVSLFQEEGKLRGDLLSARTRLRHFDKYAVPAFSFILAFAFLGVSGYVWRRILSVEKPAEILNELPAMAFLVLVAVTCFLVGRYASGMATQKEWRLLRAGGSFTLGLAVGSLLVIVGLAASQFDAPLPERIIAYILPCLMVVVSLEIVINQVLDFYRPRIEGEEWRPAYDSRALALLGTPGSIVKTVAETLDYQFGFKVSETWFYHLMQKAIAPIILFQMATLYAATCFVVVGTEEQAIVERYGRKGHVLNPGIHLKMPWPIDKIFREKTKRVREIVLGRPSEELAKPEGPIKVFLWTEAHYLNEYRFLMASERAERVNDKGPSALADEARTVPVNMVSGELTVHYYIVDLLKYHYNAYQSKKLDDRGPETLIEDLSYRELVKYLAGADLLQLLGEGRTKAGTALQGLIQERCDEPGIDLGVKIVFVGLQGLHPPIQVGGPTTGTPGEPGNVGMVGKAFEGVVAAEEQKHASVLDAQAYQARRVTLARGEARRTTDKAESDAALRKSTAEADSLAFENILKAYQIAPDVFKGRKRMEVVESAMPQVRKYFLPFDYAKREVAIFDWEDKLKTELLDMDLSKEKPQ